jgi:hypothetical protein
VTRLSLEAASVAVSRDFHTSFKSISKNIF